MESTENDVKPGEAKPPREFSSPWHFSDVVLVVEDAKFHVHRSTLSMWSPVFEKMFTSDFSEKTAKEIPLPEKSADEMEVLLKVIYSSDANQKITEKNHEFLLELAREYQMEKIKQYCYQYMQGSINKQNCLRRCKVADRFGFKDVIERCKALACLKYSTELERSADYSDLEPELKSEICMARIKELEKTLKKFQFQQTKMESTENDVKPAEAKPAREFSSPWHFSDVVLVVEYAEFHVHRSTLSIWSPVFEKMFASDPSETNTKRITLSRKSADQIEVLLKVIYSQRTKQKVTEENYEFLLELAEEYQMEGVKSVCAEYLLRSRLSEQNCLQCYGLADRFGLDDALKNACNDIAKFKSSATLESSKDFNHVMAPESKLRICMARVKELEKPLTEYVTTCSVLVSKYYETMFNNVPSDITCDNERSHSMTFSKGLSGQKIHTRKSHDISCEFCIARVQNTTCDINTYYLRESFRKLHYIERNNRIVKQVLKK